MRMRDIPRREFMKGAAAAGAGVGLVGAAPDPEDTVGAVTQQVPRKLLGSTGESVPILCMGCCQTLDPKYDKRLHRGYALGVDWLDSAQMYADGQNHKTIAPFIKQIGDRKKLFISSKVYLGTEEATPEKFVAELETCLADLETDYLDIFFMHMLQDEKLLGPDFIKMAEDLKKAGKIRFFGFSSHHGNVPEMMQAGAKLGGGIDAILFRYNFRQYGDAALNNAIDACKKAGIGLIAMKTLGSIPDDAEEAKVWQSKDFTLTQAKLKAVWADERIDAIASQMGNVQHVMENTAAAISPVQLSMVDFQQLRRYAARTAGRYCMGCAQHCESRIDGAVRVADTLRYLMYHESYGERERACAAYRALRPEERRLDGVDFSRAMAACPQGIDIGRRLDEAQRILSA